ncbi:hypothetical protein AJ78_08660, partial [Emergomyces pasteurianus Ep9510]
LYKVPYILLQLNWTNKVDSWSMGVVAWHFVALRALFRGRHIETNEYHDANLLAEQSAVMCPPPLGLRRMSKVSSIAWGEEGKWKGIGPMPDITLEQLADGIQGDKEKVTAT